MSAYSYVIVLTHDSQQRKPPSMRVDGVSKKLRREIKGASA